MNALKAFVMVIGMLFFAATATITSAATVVMVSIVPGNEVGLHDNGSLWSGYVLLDINGEKTWGATDFMATSLYDPMWYNNPTPREMILYTRDDILAGAPVAFSQTGGPYDLAAQFFAYGLLGATTGDNHWGAAFNEMIWETMDTRNGPNWYYANNIANPGPPPITFVDVYNSLLPAFSTPYDFGSQVGILFDPYSMDREFMVQVVATPVPSAVWLFMSGILALVAIGRRKTVRI